MSALKTVTIHTCMGRMIDRTALPYLSEEEKDEFDLIGYSGRDSSGKKVTRKKYLNSLQKGEFDVTQTRYDRGDFCESFVIVRYCPVSFSRKDSLDFSQADNTKGNKYARA